MNDMWNGRGHKGIDKELIARAKFSASENQPFDKGSLATLILLYRSVG